MKWFRRIGITLVVLFLLFVAGVLVFLHNMDFSESEENIAYRLNNSGYPYHSEVVDFEGQPVHYVEVGDSHKPPVLFVHGSPGTWDNFLEIVTNSSLLERTRAIAITRPGYGKSGAGIYEPSLEKQAAALQYVMDLRSPNEPAVLVGHSYGGPLIVRMAMDAPDRVASLVLIAASIAPELEETKWFQIPGAVPPLSWLMPDDLLVCNLEILALKEELEMMMPMWRQITQPVTVIHGDQDNLVPVANAEFATRQLTNTEVNMKRFNDMNHFIIWTHKQLVIDSVLEQMDVAGDEDEIM